MSVAEFKAFLLQLAQLYEEAGKGKVAIELQNLAEVFDGDQNHKVARFVDEVRRARGITLRSVEEAHSVHP